MSILLSKFEALTIATASAQQQWEYGESPPLFPLPRPPRQLAINPITNHPYIQYYGYEVTNEWLVRLAERNCPEELPDRQAQYYDHDAMMQGFYFLCTWANVVLGQTLCFKSGSVPPDWWTFEEDHHPEEESPELVHVLVLCSDRDEWRTTQEQVDFLTNCVGYGPKWWLSCGFGRE